MLTVMHINPQMFDPFLRRNVFAQLWRHIEIWIPLAPMSSFVYHSWTCCHLQAMQGHNRFTFDTET